MLIKKYALLWLIICLSLTITGIGVYYVWYWYDYQRQEALTIKQNLHKALEKLKQEQATLEEMLGNEAEKKIIDLQSYAEVYYPFFIYKNSKLIAWSDHHYIPDYTTIQGKYKERFFYFSQEHFVASSTLIMHDNDTLELYQIVPIYRKYKIENSYLRSGYAEAIAKNQNIGISNLPHTQHDFLNINNTSGKFLFSVESSDSTAARLPYLENMLIALVILWSIALAYQWAIWLNRWFIRRKKHFFALCLWGAYWALLRLAVFLFYVPTNEKKSIELMLLDVLITAAILFYVLFTYRRFRVYVKWLNTNKDWLAYLNISGLVLLAYGATWLYFYTLYYLIDVYDISLHIRQTLQIDGFQFVGWLIFLCLSIAYFVSLQIILRSLTSVVSRLQNRWIGVAIYICVTLVYMIISYSFEVHHLWLIVLHSSYVGLVMWVRFAKYLYRYEYLSSLYLLISSVLCALIGTQAISLNFEKKQIETKRNFAITLLAEKDAIAEAQLSEALSEIAKDPLMSAALSNPMISRKIIEQRIRRYYLNNYFDKYEIHVYVFDSKGEPFKTHNADGEKILSYAEYNKKYSQIWYETDNPRIRFNNESGANLLKQYWAFADIKQDNNKIVGYAMIELRQKRVIKNNVFPELLLDKQYASYRNNEKYSYAIYVGKELKYSLGSYNYEEDFDIQNFQNIDIQGFVSHNFHHLVIEGGSQKRVVVSAEVYAWKNLLSDFSLLFLLLLFFGVNVVLSYRVILNLGKAKASFATRIQFYLNVAFFLPLFVVSFTILSIIGADYQSNVNDEFIQKAESIAENLKPDLDQLEKEVITVEKLYSRLSELARYVGVDMSIFNKKGELLLSSQPTIYDQNALLSRYLDYEALTSVVLQNSKYVLLAESVGALNYKSVYVPVKRYEDGALLGIISVPFFESKKDLEERISNVFSTIIIIFTATFLVFIIVSFFASRLLTKPLLMIAQKIRKTNFAEYNEPLSWHSEDEIGLLVSEYNTMLRKLEISRKSLAQNEKESAWREMARQVAHEIKNPLTPMKLTLQHLQVKLQRQQPDIQDVFERSFDTLLTQIDILSEIASSFSAYAKMPVPQSERFEIAAVVRETLLLYKNNQDIVLTSEIEKGSFYVLGDKNLMGRIFTNLILNAIQAIPAERKPEIRVTLRQAPEDYVRIEIKDNGEGIPVEIREKIFVPSFTTKVEGSGIGLAIAKRGVEHAGGRIWFETEIELGTSFFIEIPLEN
ncbi:MAG: HAMP domain-containing protein [Cytophagales bacterium]|nr:MAG: HAMP domain-containing protein [Cytophagales bacterium]